MAKKRKSGSKENVKDLTTRQLWARVKGRGGPFTNTVLIAGIGRVNTRTGKRFKGGKKYLDELLRRLKKRRLKKEKRK